MSEATGQSQGAVEGAVPGSASVPKSQIHLRQKQHLSPSPMLLGLLSVSSLVLGVSCSSDGHLLNPIRGEFSGNRAWVVMRLWFSLAHLYC